MESIMGYDKVEEQFRQKSRRWRCIIIIVGFIVLMAALIVVAVLGTLIHKNSSNSNSVGGLAAANNSPMTPSSSLRAVCSVTEYPDSCFASMISSLKSASNNTTNNLEHLFKLSLRVAFDELSNVSDYPTNLLALTNDDPRVKVALTMCLDLLEDALDRLNDSISSYANIEGEYTKKKIDDITTWLSTTITVQETCLDGLREFHHTLGEDVEKFLKNSIVFASNSLAIVSKIMGLLSKVDHTPIHRPSKKLLWKHDDDEFPDWVGFGDRRLLYEANPTPNVTVAKDGTGTYKTVKEAVDSVPPKMKGSRRYVIYVKEGVYEENVNLDKNKWNVMIYGDGKNKTIVSGNLNRDDHIAHTYLTATFAAEGKGFIARDIGFRNTAGAAKHQAVAFFSKSDMSVCYRCSFDAFQDTLYVHCNRQFYRDCDIIGTIDFIFGNAAAVFQNCNILPRQPLSNQFNTITAQGKTDINQKTGISIHKCTFTPYDNLTATTYLGRPWKNHSTTVVMQSTIGSFLNPLGWIDWNLTGVDEPPSTIFYAEYQNSGPGSSVARRVKWRGYKLNITENDARKFTVGTFIDGGDWLPATNVPFNASLS